MHSGYEIPGIQPHPENNTCAPVLLSMNQTHYLDPIHTLPAASTLPHFLPPYNRPSHHHYAGDSSYFPAVNFKLGLNEFCTRNNNNNNIVTTTTSVSCINEGGHDGNFIRGSEQYEFPETRQCSLGLLHCWQNQPDSSNKQSFWEHLPSEVSNENSEIVDRSQEQQQVPDHHHLTTCLDSRCRPHFSELEAIYRRLSTTETGRNCQTDLPEDAARLPVDGPPKEEEEEEASASLKPIDAKRKRKKTKKNIEKCSSDDEEDRDMISPMAEFFGNLVKQVMDHQDNMHKKFTQVIERLEEERRVREKDWREQELVRLEQEYEARAKEKALADNREAVIVSYLEKITGERINFEDLDDMEIIQTNN